jgi:hypothetical protein
MDRREIFDGTVLLINYASGRTNDLLSGLGVLASKTVFA